MLRGASDKTDNMKHHASSAAMPEGLEFRALLLRPSALPCPAYPARVLKVNDWENAAGPQPSSRPLRRAARNGTVFITRELNRFRGEKQFTNAASAELLTRCLNLDRRGICLSPFPSRASPSPSPQLSPLGRGRGPRCHKPRRADMASDGPQGTLSFGERAGVRGNRAHANSTVSEALRLACTWL